MKRFLLVALPAVMLSAGSAQAMNCNAVFDELMKAASGHLTMSTEKRVALTRMSTHAYDQCMAGDGTSAAATRKMVMEQIKKSLGG